MPEILPYAAFSADPDGGDPAAATRRADIQLNGRIASAAR
jgi:hypothetical protein